jgi:hypothetical protein
VLQRHNNCLSAQEMFKVLDGHEEVLSSATVQLCWACLVLPETACPSY